MDGRRVGARHGEVHRGHRSHSRDMEKKYLLCRCGEWCVRCGASGAVAADMRLERLWFWERKRGDVVV